jgi:hypothetical protein
MDKFIKKTFAIALLFSMTSVAFADKGAGKKNKNKFLLNINTNNNSLRNSIALNLKSGLKYKGSLLTSQQNSGNSLISSSVVTYQKGNTVYILPYKNKIIMPDYKQGYTGMKLIIKSK